MIFYYKCYFGKKEKKKEARRLFKELLCYNALIKKSCVKHLNNINMLHELRLYNELTIVKTSNALKGYSRRYSIKIIDAKDPSVH